MENDSRNLKFIMFHADDISSIKMYGSFFSRKLNKIVPIYLDSIFFASTQILNVLQKLRPLLRICVKVSIRENRIFRIFQDYPLLSFAQILYK